MKNTIYSLLSVFVFAVLFSACDDFNDQFEGLDDKTQIKNLAAYNYTLTEADYTTISNAAVKVATTPAEISLATSIKNNKYFTTAVPASTYVPFLLKTQYPYADLGSTAMVTYAFNEARPAYLDAFANASVYTLNNADYASSGSNALGFYPNVNPANFLPDILAANVADPTDGKITLAKYSQYTEVPSFTTVSNYLMEENFNYGATAGNLTTITNNWVMHSPTTPVGYATTSLSMTGYPSSGIGGSATILTTNTEDINRSFTPQTTGKVYASTLVNFSAVGVGTYFLHFMEQEGFNYASRVSAKDNGSGKILFGIGASSTITYGTTAFDLNTTYLVVTSYDIATATSKLYVLSTAPATEPATAEASSTHTVPFTVHKIGIRQGGNGLSLTLDGVRVAKTWAALMVNVVTTTIEGNKTNEEAYYQYAANKWTPAQGIYVVTANDYQSMGTATGQPGKNNYFISKIQSEGYLPTLLAKLYPYAQNGNKQIVAYKYNEGGVKTGVDEYIFQAGKWYKPSSVISKTEQFVFSNIGWVFDPTVKIVMGTADYQLMVDYVLATPSISIFAHPFFKNEEYYYGFASRFNNVSFRLSYRNPSYFTGAYIQPASIDPELNALTTDAAKVALMWTRLKEGMGKFLQLKYPNAVPTVSGLDVYYHATTNVYYPTGISAGNELHKYIFKCTAAASGSTPPVFEFISEGIVN